MKRWADTDVDDVAEMLSLVKQAGFDLSSDYFELIMPGHPMGKVRVGAFQSHATFKHFLETAIKVRKAAGERAAS